MMGLLDRRTPPGDPTNYPLAWQRDGVAVVAGLVRAGQLEVAKELARYFAENDFFGGFGAEGDAPGQGLRVLEDVAGRLHDPAFDQWLWPHVQRKAAIILKMVSTDKPLRAAYVGPIVPAHRQSRRSGSCLRAGPRRAHHGPHGFLPPGIVYHGRQLPRTPQRGVAGPAIETRRGGRALAGRRRATAKGLARRAAVERIADLHLRALAHLGRGRRQVELSRTPPAKLQPAIVRALDLFRRGDDPSMGPLG